MMTFQTPQEVSERFIILKVPTGLLKGVERMRKVIIVFVLSLVFISFSVNANEAHKAEFELYSLGKEGIIDYEEYGEFQNVGAADYKYKVTDREGLKEAAGEGVYPNTKSVYEDPLYKKKKDEGALKGNHWDFVNIDDHALSFYKWATAPESPGVKQYYTALALEKAGYIQQAIKGYYAILVHFPKAVGWTSFNTPWYVGKVAKKRIQYLTRKHPELGIKLVDSSIHIKDGFDIEVSNDEFVIINPGKLITSSAQEEKKIDLSQLKIIDRIGDGRVQLIQYENGHWQLLVDNKPFVIKGISYKPVKIGQSPDEGTLEDWMLQDTNNNELIDAPCEAWVDKNGNNKQDADEPNIGDFQLMKEMGVNTLRLYHHASNKELLRSIYEDYGIMVMLGDFVGMYTVGSGASWEEGTDYTDPTQRENMFESVKQMVTEFKDEPYILMWVLGNENNYGGVQGHVGGAGNAAQCPKEYYSFINNIAKWIKENDPNHPVAICNGDTLLFDILAKECPDVDIFGANSYQGSHGFSFWEDVKTLYDKPVVITEYGCPSYHEGKPPEVAEKEQIEYHWGVWTDIMANSAGFDGTGNALGGVVFEWLDGWWKSGQPPFFSPYVHEPNGQWKGPFPNGWSYEEWFGLCSQGNGNHSPFMRQLRDSFYLYQQLWTGKQDPVYAGGRINADDKDIYVYKGKAWDEILDIPYCHEIYALAKDTQDNLWAAGNYYGEGKVWKYDGKTWDDGEILENTLVIYDLYVDNQGNLWAAGAGGSKIWMYNGKEWKRFKDVSDATAIYALHKDKQGNIWAAGAPLNVANIWKYDGTNWTEGGQLLGSESIYCLSLDSQGNLYAAGTSKTDRNLWQYDYEKKRWNKGIDLLDCEAIYALYRDSQGNLWAAGAGGSKIWKYDGKEWNELGGLKDCIAIYSLTEDKAGNIYAGGWSLEREASIWKYNGSSGWMKEKDLEGFVIRAMEFIP